MSRHISLLRHYSRIQQAARSSEDGQRCTCASHPDLQQRLKKELESVRGDATTALAFLARAVEPRSPGLNDGMIIPPEEFPLGTPFSVIRSAAADRAPLRGVLRVIVVLVDFSDLAMAQTQAHYRDLFFSQGVLPTGSVREYYAEVTHGLVDIQGDVVGPFRMPQTLAQYAHGASGLGNVLPNAQTMAGDAVTASDPGVNFDPFDNDANGFVDAFIVIHAGPGAEVTGNSGHIWSHKWVLSGGARSVDHTKIFGYLTVPEDARIGVCCHELGHLLFGFPDLYDTDNSSQGIGNWCLMAGGSWGGGGDRPVHPSAWCKANQAWVSVDNRTSNGALSVPDVKDSLTVYRLWKGGAPGSEYFLLENRQQKQFDQSLPGSGLLIWHIDETIATNTDENHYKVALLQADGRRDMEHNLNRGDAGDPYPGASNNTSFTKTSNPNSKSYSGGDTCVAVTGISASSAVMNAHVTVSCKLPKESIKEIKEIEKLRKEVVRDKALIDVKVQPDKRPEKPQIDKRAGFDKGPADKLLEKRNEGKLIEGGRPGGGGLGGRTPVSSPEALLENLQTRVENLEFAVSQLTGSTAPEPDPAQPFIGTDLRPDLTQGAISGEEDYQSVRERMGQGAPSAKRIYDSKQKE